MVWWSWFLLLLTTSASTCLQHSRNHVQVLFPGPVYGVANLRCMGFQQWNWKIKYGFLFLYLAQCKSLEKNHERLQMKIVLSWTSLIMSKWKWFTDLLERKSQCTNMKKFFWTEAPLGNFWTKEIYALYPSLPGKPSTYLIYPLWGGEFFGGPKTGSYSQTTLLATRNAWGIFYSTSISLTSTTSC